MTQTEFTDQFLAMRFTKYKSFVFSFHGSELHQYSGWAYEILPGDLSHADKLNGIEWKGAIQITAQAERHARKSFSTWTQWGSCHNNPLNFLLQKGTWIDMHRQLGYKAPTDEQIEEFLQLPDDPGFNA